MTTSSHHPSRHAKILTITIVAVVLALLPFLPRRSPVLAPTNTNAYPSSFQLTTADGIKIQTQLYTPMRNIQVPAVILVHQFGADRHQWDSFIATFTDAGIAVLAYDSRGFGQSNLTNVRSDSEAFVNSMPNDVAAAVLYLRSQPFIDQTKISVLGAGLGGNVAYVASGRSLGLFRAVAIFPSFDSGFLTGQDIAKFQPVGILAIGDKDHPEDVATIIKAARDPKQSILLPNRDTAGVEVLTLPETRAAILQWINPSS